MGSARRVAPALPAAVFPVAVVVTALVSGAVLAAAVLAGAVPAPGSTASLGTSTGATAGRPAAPVPAPKSAPTLRAGETATVTYCNHQRARITEPARFRTPAAPVAVYVHGGSWVSGDYDTGGFLISRIGPALAKAGFVVVSLDYRLGPRAKWPDQIVDVKCAIRYLRANAPQLHLDPTEIGAWGQSAGGHLVALLGMAGPSAGWDQGAYAGESSRVQSVVDMAGPSDFLTLGNKGDSRGVTKSFVSLLGSVPAHQLGAELLRASPVSYVAPDNPPFLILNSNDDIIVNPRQSVQLARDLGAAGVPHQLVTVTDGGHEFDTPGEIPSETGIVHLVVDYLVQTLVFHQNPAATS